MPESRPRMAALPSLALASALLLASAARAQPAAPAGVWAPDRAVRLVVPSEAGGSTDVTARLVAERLGPRLGQPVVVENRPGAGGSAGWRQAARAAPDGHPLVMAVSTMVASQALYRTLPFHPQRDFAPVSLTAVIPNLLVVRPDVPARDLGELIALARAKPRTVNYGAAGNGTPHHVAAESFVRTLNVGAVCPMDCRAAFEDVAADLPHLIDRVDNLRRLHSALGR